jgi:hypothetical protein
VEVRVARPQQAVPLDDRRRDRADRVELARELDPQPVVEPQVGDDLLLG